MIRSCILVLNYNGRAHLDACLTTALAAAARVHPRPPVVVVDNRSTEGDVAFIRERHPGAEVEVAERNDFLFSLNEVVRRRTEDVVVILNNDMRFDERFVEAMLPHFQKPDVFAVTAKVFDWTGDRLTTGQRVADLRRFWLHRTWNHSPTIAVPSMDAGGGCAAFRRSMFLALGGFNRLYHPAYWEDTDLSYRAWQRGWRVLYEPRSVMYHKVGATLASTDARRIRAERIIRRNEILFALRNVGDWRFLLGFLALLPVRAVRHMLAGHSAFGLGTLMALPRVPSALWQRWGDRVHHGKDEIFMARIREGSTSR